MRWIDGVEYCNHGHEMTASNTRIVEDRDLHAAKNIEVEGMRVYTAGLAGL